MTTLPFLLLALSPVIFGSDYALISCPLCKSDILWNIFMIFYRNVEQDETTRHIQELQLWVSYFWGYLPFFVFVSCPLCNTNALRNILTILGRNIEQDEMTCCIQEWQLWLSYFWSYLSFLCLNLISCQLCNSNTLWIIWILLCRNVEQDETTCCVQELQLWRVLGTFVFFFFFFFFFLLKNTPSLCLKGKSKAGKECIWNKTS